MYAYKRIFFKHGLIFLQILGNYNLLFAGEIKYSIAALRFTADNVVYVHHVNLVGAVQGNSFATGSDIL